MFPTDTQTNVSAAGHLASYMYLCGTSDIQWPVQSITIQLSSQVLQHPYFSASLVLLPVYSKCPKQVSQFFWLKRTSSGPPLEKSHGTLTQGLGRQRDSPDHIYMRILMFRFAVEFDCKAIYFAACFNPQKGRMKIDFPKAIWWNLLPVCDIHQCPKCCIVYSQKSTAEQLNWEGIFRNCV